MIEFKIDLLFFKRHFSHTSKITHALLGTKTSRFQPSTKFLKVTQQVYAHKGSYDERQQDDSGAKALPLESRHLKKS